MSDTKQQAMWPGVTRAGWKKWGLVALAVGLVFYFGLDVFQGKMFGMLSGTTADPRAALGTRTRSLSMEPQLFTLSDTVVGRERKAEKDIEIPQVTLAIPKAYINVVRTEKDGWFGTNTLGVALQISSENFKPYRAEFPRVRDETLDKLNIELVTDKPSALFPNPERRPKVFPDADAQARYDSELLRRGFTRINTGIGTGAKLDPEKRVRSLLHFPFRNADRNIKRFEALNGCVTSRGPYPNSVRYDHSPKASEPMPGARKTSCIRTAHQPVSFVVVQYDNDDTITMTVTCRFHSNGANSCHAKFYWREIWSVGLVVAADYVNRIPEFVEKTKALFDSFELAARRLPL